MSTKTLIYIGTVAPYFESAVTGRPQAWYPNQISDVPTAQADQLLATGAFRVTRVAAPQFSLDPTTGAVVGLVGPDGVAFRNFRTGRNTGVEPVVHPLTSSGVLSTVQQGGGTVTVTDVSTADGAAIRVQGSTAGSYVEVAWALPVPISIVDAVVNIQLDANQSTMGFYAADSSGYTNFLSKGANVSSSLNNSIRGSVLSPIYFSGGTNILAASGTVTASTLFTHMKLRITPVAGQLVDATISRIVFNTGRKGRISITADDGYDSWWKYAVPALNKRGLRSSMAVIPTAVGTAGYMTLAQLQKYVAMGHECVPHGPIGGSGSLIDNYATVPEMIADVEYTRSYLQANNLSSAHQASCYVWPQGKFQSAINNTALLDAMKTVGVKMGRGIQRFVPYQTDVASASNYGAMIIPIIGHQRATTEANENAEIASIISAIQYCAANGVDGVLMFHKIIADQAVFSATSAIEIEISRFTSILDEVVTQRAAGKIDVPLMSELIL